MERGSEEMMQSVLDFNCKKILPVVEKSSSLPTVKSLKIVENQDVLNNLAFDTPTKTTETLQSKIEGEAVELTDRYRTITELFDGMTTSVRLLSLSKKLTTFQNVSTQVEILTKRKFSFSHLAQMKYILPEVIQIEKIATHDEKTLCMKLDMKISVLSNVIESNPGKSVLMALRETFHAKVLDFLNTNPEDCEIPGVMLPVPFNQRSHIVIPETLPRSSIQSDVLSNEHETSSELFRETSSKFFHQPAVLNAVQNPGNGSFPDSENQQQKSCSGSPCKSSSRSPAEFLAGPESHIVSAACKSPLLNALNADNLEVQTPALLPPKRLVPGSIEKINTEPSETMTLCHISAKRHLNFLSSEDEHALTCIANVTDGDVHTTETTTVLMDGYVTGSGHLQKVGENNGCNVKDHNTGQTDILKRQKILACLPDLFNLIHHIFQSAKCSYITEQEFMYKIISNNFDIVERREIEEQLELLEELVPDWICRKLVPSGDILYSIQRVSNLESIRTRLVEAARL